MGAPWGGGGGRAGVVGAGLLYQAEQDIDQAQSHIGELSQTVSEVNAENTELRKQVSELSADLAACQSSRNALLAVGAPRTPQAAYAHAAPRPAGPYQPVIRHPMGRLCGSQIPRTPT